MKICTCTNGGKMAIGVSGTREERERFFNIFFNWGAVAAGLSSENQTGRGESLTRGDSFFHESKPDKIQGGAVVENGFSYFFAEYRLAFRALANFLFYRGQASGESKRFKGKPRAYCFHIIKKAFKDLRAWECENFLSAGGVVNKNFRILDGGAVEWVPEFED